MKLGVVCVHNAGRSQMAAAVARQGRKRRGVEHAVGILTGSTHPGGDIHPGVVEEIEKVGSQLADQALHAVSTADLNECDVVATMGCSTLDGAADGDVRDWALEDPHGNDIKQVCEIRDDTQHLVAARFEGYGGTRRADDSQTRRLTDSEDGTPPS